MTSDQKKSEIVLRLKVHFSHLFVHVTREYVGIYVQSGVIGHLFLENHQDDRNNECLCKSEEISTSNVKVRDDPYCPLGWYSYGHKCVRFTADNKQAHRRFL